MSRTETLQAGRLRRFPFCVVLSLMSGVAAAQTAEARIAAAVAEIDRAVVTLDVEALGRVLSPQFTESTKGCGPAKPRSSRKEYMATFAGVVKTKPIYHRERSQVEVKLLGDGEFGVVRSKVTDRVEWPSGSLTATSTEALYFMRVGDGYKATSLDASLACTDMKLVGSMPPPPGS